ncbi:abortive infection system antitoxin AbiGi family protein [Nitrosomonas sp. sh817]|uniref:abortive infection system antitoxin AbiGi family protein n=1 Tax=Nitrosomonas sp. sh817 TaxID=3070658 RepID=UPI0027DD93D6|nr:abortive infection system antitoxin AbiGi family protein [Nitrosomonas sp. sh817]WMJ09133.1 abortive infection system antitoxin AbiGi family protein [Nitrosomonas sp. sh817]
MSIISDNLIHFLARSAKDNPLRQLEVCTQIFEQGLRTSVMQVKFPDGSFVFNQVICFTDIPLKECDDHTSIYGKFGIGFKKSFVKNAGGNPARYFVDYATGNHNNERRGVPYLNLWEQFKFVMALRNQLVNDSEFKLLNKDGEVVFTTEMLNQYVSSAIYAFSFDKEMGDLGPARDETKEIDLYYKEREWRLVPSAVDLQLGIVNEISNEAYYKFNRSDVNMVVVPNEDIRIKLLNYFLNIPNDSEERLVQFKENPLPIIHYDDLQKW